MATCSSIVYTNGPNGHREAPGTDLCTLLRPRGIVRSSIVYTNGPNGRPEALTLDLCTLLRSLTARAALATTHGPCGKITRLERGQVDRRLTVYGSIVFQHSRNYETMRAMVFLDHAGAQLQDLIRGGVKRGALANVAPR